jgi:hypothetical protein
MYFKEPVPSLAHEARLIEILAGRRSELVTEVLVADGQGRMLTRDGGVQLSKLLEEKLELRHWEQALPLYAELQIGAAQSAEEFVAAGAFDRRATVLPAIYEELLGSDPHGLTGDESERLRGLVPEVAVVCEQLGAHAVPETIQNDDFTDGSIFLREGSYRFLDWGDACVSHPFFTLTVTLRVIELRHGLPAGSAEIERIRDVYLEPFTRFEPRETLVSLAGPARRIGQICRAAMRFEAERTGDYSGEPDELAWSLRLLLDPECWRTWDV